MYSISELLAIINGAAYILKGLYVCPSPINYRAFMGCIQYVYPSPIHYKELLWGVFSMYIQAL